MYEIGLWKPKWQRSFQWVCCAAAWHGCVNSGRLTCIASWWEKLKQIWWIRNWSRCVWRKTLKISELRFGLEVTAKRELGSASRAPFLWQLYSAYSIDHDSVTASHQYVNISIWTPRAWQTAWKLGLIVRKLFLLIIACHHTYLSLDGLKWSISGSVV